MSNRLAQINATQGNNTWHHTPTHLNPADHGTRGLKPTDIESKWLAAPSFLMSQSSQWPPKSSVMETKRLNIRLSVCITTTVFRSPSL